MSKKRSSVLGEIRAYLGSSRSQKVTLVTRVNDKAGQGQPPTVGGYRLKGNSYLVVLAAIFPSCPLSGLS